MKSMLAVLSFILAIGLFLIALNQGLGILLHPVKAVNQFVSADNFNADLWKAQYGKNLRDNPRSSMIVDLEREVLREGMSRAAVREILGVPEQVQENADLYDLGASPYGIDYEQYAITYDQENEVVVFSIRRG